jgi:predicted dehydrogenase
MANKSSVTMNGRSDMQVGIVGAGAVVQSMYARSLPRLDGVVVTRVHDLNEEAARAGARLFGATVSTLDAMWDVGAVIIATPPATHHSLVSIALRKCSLVICEKPFVGTAAEAGDLVSRAAGAGSRLFVAHLRRVFPAIQLARSLAIGGSLGRLKAIDVSEGARFNWDAQSGYTSADPTGGVLFDTGSHTLDSALFIAGLDAGDLSVDRVAVRRDKAEPSHDLSAEVVIHAGGDDIALRVDLSRRRTLANRMRFEFECGVLTVPVGLLAVVRLDGPHGTTFLHSGSSLGTFEDCFIAQWQAILQRQSPEFEARRFVGLSRLLQAIAEAG